jgi:hypothetical protein
MSRRDAFRPSSRATTARTSLAGSVCPCREQSVSRHTQPVRRRPVSTPGRTRRYIEKEAGELALAEIASRRLPFLPVGTPASGRLYPLEGRSMRADRHEPGAADESCG